jgi:hypothetical protein
MRRRDLRLIADAARLRQDAAELVQSDPDLARLRVRSCIIDGEAVACGEDGISSFDRIRYRQNDKSILMWAFDLIELDSDGLRLDPLEVRSQPSPRCLRWQTPAYC